MKPLLLVLLALAAPAHADLYRWVDPASGSIKYSSVPPDWYGDPLREGITPKVEVLRYTPLVPPAPLAPPAPSASTAPSAAPVPAVPAAAAAPADGPLAVLQERWRGMLQFFTALPARPDFDRAGQAFQQQLQAFEAVRVELDRLDPAGAQRRRAEAVPVLEQLKPR